MHAVDALHREKQITFPHLAGIQRDTRNRLCRDVGDQPVQQLRQRSHGAPRAGLSATVCVGVGCGASGGTCSSRAAPCITVPNTGADTRPP